MAPPPPRQPSLGKTPLAKRLQAAARRRLPPKPKGGRSEEAGAKGKPKARADAKAMAAGRRRSLSKTPSRQAAKSAPAVKTEKVNLADFEHLTDLINAWVQSRGPKAGRTSTMKREAMQ